MASALVRPRYATRDRRARRAQVLRRREGPLISREIRACFLAEASAGRDIEFARVEPTTEGDPIATVFGFEPGAGLSMAVDSTQDKFGVPAWSVSFCRRIVPEASMVFEFADCVSGPSFR